MNKDLMIFEGQEVMILTKEDVNINFKGDFLIRSKDVANILGYQRTENIYKLCKEHEIVKVKNSDFANTANPKLNNAGENFITSFGLNRVLGKSEMPKAESFQDWLYEEVLPSIQRTGGYSVPDVVKDYLSMSEEDRAIAYFNERKARKLAEEQKLLLQKENEELKPKALIHDQIVEASNLISVNKVAKNIGLGERKLFEFLRATGIFYKEGRDNLPKQSYQNSGYFEVKATTIEDGNGNKYINYTTKITGKGEIFLLNLINDYGGAKVLNKLKVNQIKDYVAAKRSELKVINI